jgi:hypothetical protein
MSCERHLSSKSFDLRHVEKVGPVLSHRLQWVGSEVGQNVDSEVLHPAGLVFDRLR